MGLRRDQASLAYQVDLPFRFDATQAVQDWVDQVVVEFGAEFFFQIGVRVARTEEV